MHYTNPVFALFSFPTPPPKSNTQPFHTFPASTRQPSMSTMRTSIGDGGLQNRCWNICCTLSIVRGVLLRMTATWPTQKKIWIHLMQNIFRNQTVKNLTILDNPFKRYDFSKFSLNSVKSLCRPHKLATVPCHGCTTPHWFCTQIITNFQFSWIWVKLLIKLIPKSIQIHIYPKQTWLISRGNLLFTWELYF